MTTKRALAAATLLLASIAHAQEPSLSALCPRDDVPNADVYWADPKAHADDFCALAWHEPAKARLQLGKMVSSTRTLANGNRFYFPFAGPEPPIQILREGMGTGWRVTRLPTEHVGNHCTTTAPAAEWIIQSPNEGAEDFLRLSLCWRLQIDDSGVVRVEWRPRIGLAIGDSEYHGPVSLPPGSRSSTRCGVEWFLDEVVERGFSWWPRLREIVVPIPEYCLQN